MLAIGAFAATQAAAAAAGLSWLLVEWLHRGKPTALGLASGIVAGLVAVTPASGFVTVGSGLAIGLIAGVVCYGSVALKPKLGYDDSLDAFGVHGVGGFLGAILTGFFYNKSIIPSALGNENQGTQIFEQTIAAVVSAGLAFVVSLVLIKLVDLLCGFTSEVQEEIEGLDHIEHGEVGFNLTGGLEGAPTFGASTPKSAVQPPVGGKRFSLVVEGAETTHLLQTWSDLCQIQKDQPPTKEFKSVYPHFTTIQGNRFRFNGGETEAVRVGLEKLLRDRMKNAAIKVRIES
jgi:Amt family ammonium transporter